MRINWLGRTVDRAGWNDACSLKNNTTRAKVIDGAKIPGKMYAVNVQHSEGYWCLRICN